MLNLIGKKDLFNKSWGSGPKILVLTVIVIVIISGVLVFGLWLGKKSASPPPQETITPTTTPETTDEIIKPGDVGELPPGEQPQLPPGTPETPQVVFNTTGKIIEVQKDRLIVEGSGFNFADQKPRNLTVIFTSLTITFERDQQTKYQALEGLKHLKVGIEILIDGEENLRGKTEFIARTINII